MTLTNIRNENWIGSYMDCVGFGIAFEGIESAVL